MNPYRDLFSQLHEAKKTEPVSVELPSSITLRPYQAGAIDGAFAKWEQGLRSVLIQLPTGCGKSIVFSEIMRRMADRGRILLLAHRRELIEQAKQHAENAGLTAGIEMGGDRAYKEQVICSSVQTQVSKQHCRSCAKQGCDHCRNRGWWYRFERFNPGDFGLVVVDECHHSLAVTYRRVMEHYQGNADCKVLGVTATPHRGDGLGMWNVFDACAYEMDIRDAISNGWLVPVRQQFVTVNGLDLSKVETKAGGDLADGALQRAMLGADDEEEAKMLHAIAAPLVEIARGQPSLVFASGCDHAVKLTGAFNSYPGIRAECVLGSTDPFERSRIMDRYKRNETNVLVNVGVATEGFDAPATAVVGIARPTKSLSLYMQMIGRGTRPLKGVVDGPETTAGRIAAIARSAKPFCTVVDFCGNAGRHKLVSMVDVLAGDEATDLQAEMVELAKQSKEPLTVEELQKRVEQMRERKEKAEQERREQLQNAYKAERVDYTADTVDIFGGSKEVYREVVWEQRTGTLTEKQYNLLCKLGIKPEAAAEYTVRQAGAILDAKLKGTGPDFVLTFGKHQGRKLSQVPTGYLRWLSENGIGKAADHARMILNGGNKAENRALEDAPF